MPPEEIVETLVLQDVKDRPWNIEGCSAKTGKGLEEGFKWVVEQMWMPQG